MKLFLSMCVSVMLFTGCGKSDTNNPFTRLDVPTGPSAARPASIGIIGDTTDVQTTTKGGLVIMGGGTDVDAAFEWMIARSGGGDAVIIRATGTDAYNPYVNKLGKLNSVETMKIDSRKLAEDDGVARIIRNAELLFIAGGDQSDYTGYWKDTKVMKAINYLLTEKKVPVGGTSAGAAILGNYYFSGERGSVESATALANPYATDIALYKDDFLKAPFMQNVITDQHFTQREREGRMGVFLGRIMTDWSKAPYGIAVDEKTAVCVDDAGMAQVLGDNKAYFLKTSLDKAPETFATGKPVTWNRDGKAVMVSTISAKVKNNQFNISKFEPANELGLENSWWYFVSGNRFVIAQ